MVWSFFTSGCLEYASISSAMPGSVLFHKTRFLYKAVISKSAMKADIGCASCELKNHNKMKRVIKHNRYLIMKSTLVWGFFLLTQFVEVLQFFCDFRYHTFCSTKSISGSIILLTIAHIVPFWRNWLVSYFLVYTLSLYIFCKQFHTLLLNRRIYILTIAM